MTEKRKELNQYIYWYQQAIKGEINVSDVPVKYLDRQIGKAIKEGVKNARKSGRMEIRGLF